MTNYNPENYIKVKAPYGYYADDYYGYLPDGTKQRFPTEKEYIDEFRDILKEEMNKIRSRENAALL